MRRRFANSFFLQCFVFFVSLSLSFSLCVSVHVFTTCVTLLLRIANHMVMDNYCRGGIVNTRVGCSFVPRIRPESPTALSQFRASTSNSPIDLFRPHTHTHIRCNHHTFAQQDIRVCGDDHCQPPLRQFPNPKALCLLRVSI